MRFRTIPYLVLTACAWTFSPASQAVDSREETIRHVVDHAIGPVMTHHGIHGMAVGIVDGDKHYVINYGVASTQTRKPVVDETLFELGSISKTFTATLALLAQVDGRLSLTDSTEKFLPALRQHPFGNVSLLELGTHTPGGLPLQLPDDIRTDAQLIAYLKAWQPVYPPGTYRTYANPGIGMLGVITAKSMGQPFDALEKKRVFEVLGMRNTYINIPASKRDDYAQGYDKAGAPIRMGPGMLSSEAYGVKSTAGDMMRFLDANMQKALIDADLQKAIIDTHRGYFKVGPMTQDVIWEQYPFPVSLPALLKGNSAEIALNPTPVERLTPPLSPRDDVWINKTGSTNGFGAYIAFIPARHVGIVMLANKNYPINDRVAAAYQIIMALTGKSYQ